MSSEPLRRQGRHPGLRIVPKRDLDERIWVYECRVCGKWFPCMSEQIREGFKRIGFCGDCLETDFFRARCHVAFLEESIIHIADVGKAIEEARKPVYRQLYAKRSAQLRYAKAVLGRVRKSA